MTRAVVKKFHAGRQNHYREPAELTEVTRALRHTGRRIALVPTMGALHGGHLSLVRTARRTPGVVVVVSIFVNPLQFGAGEDLEAYPRTLDADLELLRGEGVEAVFAPSPQAMYPAGPRTTVTPGPLGTELEGAARPGHFAGMLTVVAKLLHIVRPDSAYFGEKDYQQLVLIRQLVADLDLAAQVVGVPTVREPDGLAMSSRNRFLDAGQREQAVALSAALLAARNRAALGPAAALDAARTVLGHAPAVGVEYLALRSPDLAAAPTAGPARLLVAARLGTTRLIDNTALDLGGTAGLVDHPGVAAAPHGRN